MYTKVDLKIKSIISYFGNIREDTKDIDFNVFKSDRRRVDAVLFNLTRISWVLKKVIEIEDIGLPVEKRDRLINLGSIIQSYSNDNENIWVIITEELDEYEEFFRKYMGLL